VGAAINTRSCTTASKDSAELRRRFQKTDSDVYHARKFFAERQMNTRLSPRLKLLGILMALLGSALGFRVAGAASSPRTQMH
jgi:hypothetical protein